MTAAELIDELLRREGNDKYTNDPKDPGGPTKYGITLKTLAAYRRANVTAQDVKDLTEAEAREIYESVYLKPFEEYSPYPDLFDLIVDAAVNHGVGRAKEWLSDINRLTYDELYRAFLRKRVKFYGRIITDRPSNAKFAAGWANRVAEFIR